METEIDNFKRRASYSHELPKSETNVNLMDLVGNRMMLYYFQKFLEQEYSEENLLFFLEVESFKSLQDFDALQKKALEIYSKFIDPEKAPLLVNLTEDIVFKLQMTLSKYQDTTSKIGGEKKSYQTGSGEVAHLTSDLYSQAQTEIQTLIERDTLPRFLKKASFSGTLRKPRALTKSYPKVKLDEGFLNDFVEMVQSKGEKLDSNGDCAGVLKRRAGLLSNWKSFNYVKKGQILLEYKIDADSRKENPIRSIRLKNAILQSNTNPGKENHFRVFTPQDSRTYFFQTLLEYSI